LLKFFSQGDFTQFDTLQKETQEQQKSFLDEKGFLNGVEKTYTRFIKQLQSSSLSTTMSTTKKTDCDQVSCPVCMRDFNSKSETEIIVVELKRYISKIPRKIADLDEKIMKNNEKYEDIVKLTPIKEIYENLKNTDLPQLRDQIGQLKDVELKSLKTSLRQNEYELRTLDERKQLSDKLLNLILTTSQYLSEVDGLDDRISGMSASITQFSDKTLDEVKQERSEMTEKFNNLNDKLEFKQKQLRNFEDKLCLMKETLNSLNNERLSLGGFSIMLLFDCVNWKNDFVKGPSCRNKSKFKSNLSS
jgi:hypothetical protein